MIKVQQHGDCATIAVKVHPRAKHERISGVVGDVLKLELTAPPVEGRANEACVRFFAELLKVPRSSVTIAAGGGGRNKVVRISGISAGKVEEALGKILAAN